MKRAAASTAGFVFGLLLTWLCLYIFSNALGLRSSRVPTGGCLDKGDCAWWVAPLLFCYVFMLPVLFGVLNGMAWQRWSLRKWSGWFLGLSLLTVMVDLTSYL